MISDDQFIVFYDGHCVLCNRVVQWILKYDSKDIFRFASLKGSTSHLFFDERNFNSSDLDSVILWKPNKAYWTRSTAFFEIIKQLDWRWRWVLLFMIVPKAFRDWVYTILAKRRLKWFGSYSDCPLPDSSQRYKFLS